MSLTSEFSGAVDDLYELTGHAAIHTDRDGEKTAVTVVIDHDLRQYGDIAEISGMAAVIGVRLSDLTLRPRREDTFTIGSTVYTVDSAIQSDDVEHTLIVA